MDKQKILEQAAEALSNILGEELAESSAPSFAPFPHEAKLLPPSVSAKKREYSPSAIIENLREYLEEVEWLGSVLEEILEEAYVLVEASKSVDTLLEADEDVDEDSEDIVGGDTASDNKEESQEKSEEEPAPYIPKGGVPMEAEEMTEEEVVEAIRFRAALEKYAQEYEFLSEAISELILYLEESSELSETTQDIDYDSDVYPLILALMEADEDSSAKRVYRNIGPDQIKQLVGHIASIAKFGGKVRNKELKNMNPSSFITFLDKAVSFAKGGKFLEFWDHVKPVVDVVANRQIKGKARPSQAYTYAWNRLMALLQLFNRSRSRVEDLVEEVWGQEQDTRKRKAWRYTKKAYTTTPAVKRKKSTAKKPSTKSAQRSKSKAKAE